MAMGQKSRNEAERAIRSCRRFQNSTGSFSGTRGSTDQLGWLQQHPDQFRIRELLRHATYVVWSYETPIGFVTEDEHGEVQKFYVDEQHTVTTSHHQGILRVAWGEYEVIGERAPRHRPAPRRAPAEYYGDGLRVDRQGHMDHLNHPHSVLLDARYSDPDWTPEPLPQGAEERDLSRVRLDLAEHRNPSHP